MIAHPSHARSLVRRMGSWPSTRSQQNTGNELDRVRIMEVRSTTDFIRTIRRMVARVAVGGANMLVDRGSFGMVPLQTHVVICGFPRSGSTLLQLMLASALPTARNFRTEVPALVAARRRFRNSSVMVTKYPPDIHSLGAIRKYYAGRDATAIFIVMVRDPRDILTSIHGGMPDRYYVDVDRVVGICSSVLSVMTRPAPDTFVVRYEELVSDPNSVEAQLSSLLHFETHLSEYLVRGSPPNLDESLENAIGRLRPLDASRIGRWRAPEHNGRIRQVMLESPELPDLIERLGY
jgi:hypothetical protein